MIFSGNIYYASYLSEDKEVWDQEMTLSLIDEYRNHLQDFLFPQGRMLKDIWDRISLNMHAKGFGVSASSCDQKWRQLKKTFKCNQPTAGRKTKPKWIFYEALEDILNNEEITKRINWKTAQKSTSGPSTKKESPETCRIVDRTSQNLAKIKTERPPKWFDVFLKQYQEEETRKMEMLQKMHTDLVALERQKCALLQNLIKKIPRPDPIPQIVEAVSLSQEDFEAHERSSFNCNGV